MGPPWGSLDGVSYVLDDDSREEFSRFFVYGHRGLRAVAEDARGKRRRANRQTGWVAGSRGFGKFRPVCVVQKDQYGRRVSLSATNGGSNPSGFL
jgi:hypothetical protein